MGAVWEGFLDAIGWVLAFFYGLVPSYGIAIILLTITIRLVLFPLTAKSARSMMMMQRVQPEIRRLQQKYKDDRQHLNEELMRFYKQNKINPLGGCLPLFAQMPVFFALFNVLRSVKDHVSTSSELFRAICGSAATPGACKDPKGLNFLGVDLSISALGKHDSVLDALPYFVLVGLVVVTAVIQQRQSQRFSQGNANPQMQRVTKLMPFIFAPISLSIPAGIVLYFFVSNLWQVGQQELVFKTFAKKILDTPISGAIEAKSTDRGEPEPPPKPKGFLASLREGTPPEPKKRGGGSSAKQSGNPAVRAQGGGGKGRTTPPKPTTKKAGGTQGGGTRSRKRRR